MPRSIFSITVLFFVLGLALVPTVGVSQTVTPSPAIENHRLYYDPGQIVDMLLLKYTRDVTPLKPWEQLQSEYPELQIIPEPVEQPAQVEIVQTAQQTIENDRLYYNPGQIADMLLSKYALVDAAPTDTWEQLQSEYPELQTIPEPAP